MLSRDQVQTILEDVAAQHTIKLDALAAFERREANPQLDEGRYDSLISGLAHLLAAKRGPNAQFAPEDVSLLDEHGLPPVSAEHVNIQLNELRHQRFLPTPLGKLESILARHNFDPTPSTIAQAESAYLQGIARALLDVDSRWPKFSASAVEEFNASQSPSPPPERSGRGAGAHAAEEDTQADAKPAISPVSETAEIPQIATADASTGAIHLGAASTLINDIAMELEKTKIRSKQWNTKSCKQAAQTFALFQRLVGVTDIKKVTQYTLAVFRDRLLSIPTNYDKSAANRNVPVATLLEMAEGLPDSEVGLEPKTINRHITFLNGLIRHAKSWGIALDPTIDTSLLRMSIDSKEMDERVRFSDADLRTLFSASTWCPSGTVATDTIQDATYWVPLLGYYTGARREELCGLSFSEIQFAANAGWLDLRPTRFRALKNAHSARQIPLHPEILRLGFRAYCDRIASLGYETVFPDLAPTSGNVPFGEQFYDQFKKILCKELPQHQAENKSFHSFRHGFNIQLRRKKVFLELREELMGHKLQSQSASRYVEEFAIEDKMEAIAHIEPVTSHLSTLPLRLGEAVELKVPIRQARRKGER